MRNILVSCALLLLPYVALSAENPPELDTAIRAQQPIGSTSFSKLFLHVYDAQFWSDSGNWKKPPYALTITYAMGFTPDELADRTYDEMKHVSSLPEDTLVSYSDKLRILYPKVRAGDRITALQVNAQTTSFYHNSRFLGAIHDPEFAPAFFGIWLSPKSSEPDMQKQLLPNR